MKRDGILQKIEQHYDTVWQGDLDNLPNELAPDFVDAEAPDNPPGPAAVRAMAEGMRGAFPDMRVTITNAVVEGSTAAVDAHWRGTHAATGRVAEFDAIVIWRFDGSGRIVHRIAHIDREALMTKLFGPATTVSA